MRLRFVLALVVVVFCSACRADLVLDVTANDDGSGTVMVQLDVDADAVAAVPEFGDDVRLDDLGAGGWTVERADLGGGARFTATKPFGSADGLASVVDEIGDGVVFTDASLLLTQAEDRVEYQLSVSVDPQLEPADLSDADLTGLLNGAALGGLGDDLSAADLRVTVRLSTPGQSSPVEQSFTVGDRAAAVVASSAVVDDEALALRDEAAALRRWAAIAAVVVAVLAVMVAGAWIVTIARRRRQRWSDENTWPVDGVDAVPPPAATPTAAPVAPAAPVPQPRPAPPPPAPGEDISVDTGTWNPGETA